MVPKEQLLLKVWGYDSDAEDNNVEVYISFLRRKLTHLHSAVTIRTRRMVGYFPGGGGMIRRLRWKIVAINMAMVTAVLLAVFVGVLMSSRAAVERTVNQRLMQVVQTGRYDASLPGEGSAAPLLCGGRVPQRHRAPVRQQLLPAG